MDVKTAAAALEVNPKRFRQFLRSNAKYQSPGTGGRYDLSGFSVEQLRADFESWQKVSKPRISRDEPEELNDDEELEQAEELPALPLGASREQVRAHANARVARLEALLRAKGLHLSQMQDHPSWSRITKPRTTR